MVRGLGWLLDGGYVLLLKPCDSSMRRVGRSIVMSKHEWMIFVAKYVFYRIKKVLRQYPDIIIHINVFIENDQAANMVVANDPHTITETIRFYWPCLNIRVYISPRLFSIPSSPCRHNMQGRTLIYRLDQLSGTVQLRILVQHRCHRSRFSRLMWIWKLGVQGV